MQRRLTEQGLRFLEAGQFDKAGQILSLLIKSFPDNADAHHMLGIIELEKGNYESAAKLVNAALSLEPRNSVFYNTLGNIELHLQQASNSELAFLNAIRFDPERIEYKYNLAHFYLSQGRYEKAIEYYYYILHINPTHYLSIRGLTVCYLFAGENSIALEHANEWVKEYSNHDEAYYYQGLCLYAMNNIPAALAAYDKGLELSATNCEIITAIGACYRALGNDSIAETYFHKALSLEPHNPTALYHLACIKLEQNDLKSARDLFGNAINLDESYADPILGFGRIELLKHKPEQALEHFYHALKLEPNNKKAKMLIATTLLQMDHSQDGWDMYQQALYTPEFIADIPSWDGKPLNASESLLIWSISEHQDLAHQLLFIRCLSSVLGQANTVYVLCHSAMHKLLSLSYPEFKFVSEFPDAIIDRQLCLDLLGRKYCQEHSIPANLLVDTKLRDELRAKYRSEFPQGKLAAVLWKTFTETKSIDHNKSLSLSAIEELEKTPGYNFIHLPDASTDLYELAAQLAAMDLIICVDSYIAQLAGCLGLNTYTILPNQAAWYWFDAPNATNWYPNMRLFRKTIPSLPT